jgi:hypothetical protein
MKVVFNRRTILYIIILCSIAFLYFGAKGTYTAYESFVNTEMSNRVAPIHLLINGEDLGSDTVLDNRIILDNITWTSTHTRPGKLSPGSTGSFQFELDPTGSEVAILYQIQFIDKEVDPDKIVTFQNVASDRTLVRTSIDTYSGIITLADIENGQKTHITVDFIYDDTEDIEGIREDNQVFEDFFEIHFTALQYQGEELIAYTG